MTMSNEEYEILDWIETLDITTREIAYAVYSDRRLPHHDVFVYFKYLGWPQDTEFKEFATSRERLFRLVGVR